MKRILFVIICIFFLPVISSGQMLLTIEKALEIAQENSPSMRRSLMNLEIYQQDLIAKRASLKSKFSLNLNPVDYNKSRRFDNRLSQWYTNETFSTGAAFRVDQPILWSNGVVSLIDAFSWQDNYSNVNDVSNSNKAFTNNLYLQLTQPIFTYNKLKMELKRIENNYENANISYALQRLDTEKEITRQFYTLYMAQSNFEISKEEFINAQQSFDIIKNKVEADLAAKDEFFQAELNLANAQSSLNKSEVDMENAKDILKQALGMQLDIDLLAITEINIAPIDVDVDQAITNGLGSRLELRQREIESEELDFSMIEIEAANEFKGDISLSLGLIGDNRNFTKIYDNSIPSPRVALTFTVPIFDWGEKKAKIRAAEVKKEIHLLDFHEEKISIELNIRQVWRKLENQRTQIKIAEQNVRNAQLTYDLNLTRYREGDITGMEMNQFQTQLSNKKKDFTEALIDYKIELLNLKILSLYDFEKNEAIVPLKDK